MILSFIAFLDYLFQPGTTQINKYSSVLPNGENVQKMILNWQMIMTMSLPFLKLILNANLCLPPTSLQVFSIEGQSSHLSLTAFVLESMRQTKDFF
jgi:hypothetical protein